MIKPDQFLNELISQGIEFFSGVPDSLLKHFLAHLDTLNDRNHIIATNEGSAVALAMGYNLATNKLPLVYLQNSGLGNTINPLLSLADKKVYSIPMIIMVGWRGEPGVKDEPQHIKQGEVTIELIESMNYEYSILSNNFEESKKQIQKLIKIANTDQKPVFLVVKKDTFSESKFDKKIPVDLISRESAIAAICNSIEKEDLVISTTGKASRELYEIRKIHKSSNADFLTVGGMGHANQIALGVSLFSNNKNIYCIDGDGAVLMHMGGLVQIANSSHNRFCHIIINNSSHESVGGQPTLGEKFSFAEVCKNIGYTTTCRVNSIADLIENIKLFKVKGGVVCIELICSSSSRKNLSRPSSTPLENKKSFINKLNSHKN